MEREGNEYFSLSIYTFFPIFHHGERHIFPMGKYGVGPPPQLLYRTARSLLYADPGYPRFLRPKLGTPKYRG